MVELTQRMIQCLKSCYGLEIAVLELLALGADRNASVYKAKGADQTVYFVKIRKSPFTQVSLEVLSLLQQEGIKEIVSPIRSKEGRQVEQMGDFVLIVYPFIEGENGFNRALSDQQWIQLGRAVRQIHEMKVPETIQKQIRLETFSPKYRKKVRSLDSRSQEMQISFRDFFIEHKEEIEALLFRAETISKKLEGQSFPYVLCHSDLHAGNLLLKTEAIFYLIDWDDPIMAPKERDLMFIGGGVGNVWNRPHEEVLFYEGYGKTIVNEVLLAYYRHERILEDLAEYADEFLQPNDTDRSEIYKQFIAMFDSQGVVDIALQMKTLS